MIYIDTTKYTPPKKWLDKSTELKDEMISLFQKGDFEKIKDFIDAHSSHWGKIKDDLLQLSFGKCWFSESRELFSYYHVEHFRPKKKSIDFDNNEKKGYWWLAFDWKNYCICGSVGNSNKGNYFAVKRNKADNQDDPLEDEVYYLLNPTNKEDVRQIVFNENGEAKPSNPNPNSWNFLRADYTIQKMNLDFDPLVEERRRIWNKMSDLISEVNIKDAEYNLNPSATKLEKLNSSKDKVRELIAPCAELSSTYRSCLKASGEEWAYDILQEQMDLDKYCKDYMNEE